MATERVGATIAMRALATAACMIGFAPATAQMTSSADMQGRSVSPGGDGDIVVTARRREESLIAAPVAVTALSGAELERKALVRLDNLVHSVPQLMISEAGSTPQGGIVLIRGIGVGESNPFADQAVSFNVDGVQVSRANIRRIAEVDMAQIEVLKGPQALFFGKNSPAGVIVIRTRDPGDRLEFGANASYEFVGDEMRGDAYVSGPLNDILGARLAIYGSDMDGYFRNVSTPSAALGETEDRLPYSREYGGRITLRLDPGGPFDARLKASYSHVRSAGPDAAIQTVACPYGASQLAPGIDDCRANKTVLRPNTPIALEAADPLIENVPFYRQKLALFGLEMNYQLSDALTLTSMTGYFHLNGRHSSQFVTADSDRLDLLVGTGQTFKAKEVSEELRLASDFEGPFNFMLGTHLQHVSLDNGTSVYLNGPTPISLVQPLALKQRGTAASVFLQMSLDITPTLELSGGGRYSYEKKKFRLKHRYTGLDVPTLVPERDWDDFSPEATLSWRPSDDLTVFGSYRHGFLSGGFNAGSGNPDRDRSFDQQITKGFEAGVKAQLLDGRLRTSLVGYTYDTSGLQVTANVVFPGALSPEQVVLNAAEARTRGVEWDADFQVNDMLSLHGAVAYNHARYGAFDVAPCYSGQTIALGCNLSPTPAGPFSAQDLSGQRMQRAPDWSLQGGFNFALPINDGQTLNLWSDASYSSSYYGHVANKPDSLHGAYALVDAGLSYTNEALGYTIGLIGRNLTNKYVYYRSLDSVFTGSGTGTNSPTARLSDTNALVNRGRQIMVRLSYELGR